MIQQQHVKLSNDKRFPSFSPFLSLSLSELDAVPQIEPLM